jgi:hypothetical protein
LLLIWDGHATMGEKLVVEQAPSVAVARVVLIAVRDAATAVPVDHDDCGARKL